MIISATQYEVVEWGYVSGTPYIDPFNAVTLDVVLTHQTGQSWRVPAFWAGGGEWRVRFAPPLPGPYRAVTECSNPDPILNGQSLELRAEPYQEQNPLLAHGALRVASDRRTLEYSDGTPFFWLGDTWWMGLAKRLAWPDGFQQLASDRKAKGFTVIQIVAGLYPDMPEFDPRSENEAGLAWEPGYARINPAYFDMADLRIRWLIRAGLTPCIVGGWGYYLPLLGVEKMKQHWRNLVARWAAYPVIWCLAGEALMPYYLSEHKQADEQLQRGGWTEVARTVRQIDPYNRLVTIHPTQVGRDQLLGEGLLDINMLQTGHDGYKSVPNTVVKVSQEWKRAPAMPVLVGEANYEGIMHANEAEVQRLTFWASTLSGACGHTYGANGIWQVNTRQVPYGPSPHGNTWGNTPWEDAYRLPGSGQLGLARQLLERYDWQCFEPRPDWVSPAGDPTNVDLPFAAGIPGKVRVIYFYAPTFQPRYQVTGLEEGARYQAFFWDPRCGEEHPLGEVTGDAQGSWTIPLQPELTDWVVVMERAGE